jgi:hypothetical protein
VRLWVALAILLAVVTGLTTSPEASAPLRAQTAHGVCSKYKVGALTSSRGGRGVRVAGAKRNPRWVLKKRQRVRATPNAFGTICLKRKGTTCRLWNGGAVTVAPGNGVLRFEAKEVACTTTKKNKTAPFPTATGAIIKTRDPIFVVVVGSRKTVVKVRKGLMTVTGRGRSVPLGPRQQVEVPVHAAPKQPVKAHLTPAEESATKALDKQLPKPEYVPPSANESPTVERIYQRGTIEVGIDSIASKFEKWGSKDKAFSMRYFSFLGSHWNVRPAWVFLRPRLATAYLTDQKIDVYLSSTAPSKSAQLWALPFVENPDHSVWKIFGLAADDAFRKDLRAFLLQSVQQDDYGSSYRAVFGPPGRYGIFATPGG